MEPTGSEKCLITLREHIAEFLDNISDIGIALNKKSNNLLHEVGSTSHTNINKLENIGLGMVKMLKTLNMNVLDIINLLDNDLENVNKDREEQLFTNLRSKMFKYKKSFIIDSTSNSDISSKTNVLDKDTQTDCNNDVPSVCDISPKCEISEVKSEVDTITVATVPYDINDPSTSLQSTKPINLGLIRTDTQDTDDYWIDSVNRNTTALELWNRKCQGENINVTDEYSNPLKEEQTDGNDSDAKTEDYNYIFDRQLSPKDDTFVDGKSPKVEEASGPQDKESSDVEENEESNLNDTTIELNYPSEETILEERRPSSEGLETNKSNGDSECNNEGALDTSETLQVNKQGLASTEIDDPTIDTDNDQDQTQILQADKIATSKLDTGSLNSLNEDISNTLITTKIKHLEETFKETEAHVDKSTVSVSEENRKTERSKSNVESLESLDEDMSSALHQLCDRLEATAGSAVHDGNKLSTNNSTSNDCLNEQVSQHDSDKISSGTTFSQETVILCKIPVESNEPDLDEDANQSCLSDSKKSKTADSDETDIDENSIPVPIQYHIESDTNNEKVEHLSSKKENLPDSDTFNIVEDANQLTTSIASTAFHDVDKLTENNGASDKFLNERIHQNDSDKIFSETTYSQETVALCNTPAESIKTDCTFLTDSQITNLSECVDDIEHSDSEKNKTVDSDETDIEENLLPVPVQLSKIKSLSSNEEMGQLSSDKNNPPDSDKPNITEEDASSLTTSGPMRQTATQAECIDKRECTFSGKNNVSDNEETDIDEDANKSQQTVDPFETINNKNNASDGNENETGIDEGTNKLNTTEEDANGQATSRPIEQTATQTENIDKRECIFSRKNNVSDSDETDIDEDTNKSRQTVDPVETINNKNNPSGSNENGTELTATQAECIDKRECTFSGQNNVSDGDETDIDEDANKSLQTVNPVETLNKKNNASDSNENEMSIDEGANKLNITEDNATRLTSSGPIEQTATEAETIDKKECTFSGKNNVSDGDETDIEGEANKYLQTVNPVESINQENNASEELQQIEGHIKDVDKIIEKLYAEKYNILDSDETDIEEDKLNVPISEIFTHIQKYVNPSILGNEENTQNTSNNENMIDKNCDNIECLPEVSDSEKGDRNDISKTLKQILDQSESLLGSENKSDNDNDETDLEVCNLKLSVTAENITGSDAIKETVNIEEDISSESNESLIFDLSKNVEIGDNSENDNSDSPNKLANSEEENSSKNSSRSFVFDISTSGNLTTTEEQSHNTEDDQYGELSDPKLDKYPSKDTEKKESGRLDEPIQILSDDEDDVELDVTMEEIISTGSTTEDVAERKDMKEEEIEDQAVDHSDPIIIEENIEESDTEEPKILSTQQIIGNELLELLREVEVPSDTPLTKCTSNKEKTNSIQDTKEADDIFKMLQEEESVSDLSDSEISDSINLSCSDLEIIENLSKDKRLIDIKREKSIQNNIKNLSDIKDCYVSLKKLQLKAHEVVIVNKNLDDSINRLCDISNIIGKRKHRDSQKLTRTKRVKKTLVSNKGTSDSESLSDYSHSDFESALHDNLTLSTHFNSHAEQKLDTLLANEILRGYSNDSSNESTDDSDDSNKTSEKTKNGDKGEIMSDMKHKRILSKEERMKKAWKNDPLLRGKLTSDDSTSDESTSDSEKSSKRRKALRTKYEHDTDFNIITEEHSDSDSSDENSQNKIPLQNKLISPIKRNIPIDDSTDTDSDIEIITCKQKTPDKSSELGDESGPSSSQKGRRNIRALMADESLAEATQRANKEEQERIERLEDRLKIKESFSQSVSQTIEEETLILDVDELTGEPLVTVHPKLNRRLKPHQQNGVQFMWDSCYESLERLKVDEGSGCILAHCMGLGKTFQVITLLHTLFSYEETNTKHVLVVCPTSTVNNWKKEVKIAFKHFPDDKLNVITIVDKKEVSQKYSIVKRWYLRKKSVLVLGYECFETLTNEAKLDKVDHHLKERMLEALIDPGPDLVICDEGHLLRNKKALKTLALNKIKTRRRIVLTGTPLQNNLLEYYYMVDFVKPNLLGNLKEYKTNFVNPITNGQYEDSTEEDIKLMMKRTHVLHKLLKKTIQRVEDSELKIYLPKIVDHAVFIQLNQVQVDLYNKFSKLVEKNSSKTNRKGFLSDFSIFQYICTHPHLLAVMENLRNKRIKERDLITDEQEDNPICNIEGWWKALVPQDAPDKIEYGHKLMVLKSIIEECEEIQDKVLVFSQSLGELNLIEHFLEKEGTAMCRSWKKKIDYCRMDGTVPPALRTTICDLFNDKDNKKLRVLLMSTKVGGLGLNLTAANRVIIMTVNWNPSYDIQSVFRVYRFGQEKEVYVYRLIALDSMEEKVYQRTVTKLAIAHRVVDKHQITRHYKSMDLQELYSCRPNADTERPMCNVPEDKLLAKLILKLPYIFKQHEHQALLANRPEDNLNEQELNAAWDEFKRIKDAPQIPPPQLVQPQSSVLPQVPLPNGPTFSMAYNLTRPTTSVSGGQKVGGKTDNGAAAVSHYFTPSETNGDLKKKPRVTYSTVKLNPKIPSGGVISLESDAAKTVQKDPLYIPLRGSNKTNKSYGELLSMLNEKQFAVPKLPQDTTIVLEGSPERDSQKENHRNKTSVKTSKIESVVILDEDSSKTDKPSLPENPRPQIGHNNTGGVKRKRHRVHTKEEILKRMKEGFNRHVGNSSSISVDDDDDIMVVPDTSSESGSLSNELITNLSRSGISIHKVIKDVSPSNGAIITLD